MSSREHSNYPDFNYEYFIWLLVSGLLSFFFLLYFNRLFGSIVSFAIRTWTWHRYKIYIDIRALQISLIAGRVFFSGLQYRGTNEAFLIQHGDITWRYWLRRVRETGILDDKQFQGKDSSRNDANLKLPCRINVSLVGLEWFVYNRSPAYESVLAGLKNADTACSSSNDVHNEKPAGAEKLRERIGRRLDQLEEMFPPSRNGLSSQGRPDLRRDDSTNGDELLSESDLPFMLQWLPIHIECRTAAAVIGNDNTKAVLVVKADGLTCDIDTSAARKPDPYRQLFDVDFDHPIIEIKENEDFKEDQPTRAVKEREIGLQVNPQPMRARLRRKRREVVSSLRNMVPYLRRSVESFSAASCQDFDTGAPNATISNRWQGLSRYLDDRELDDTARWAAVEYAAVATILDSPSAHLQVYWDAVAKVSHFGSRPTTADSLLHVNGGEAPAWGMHLKISGGTMNYGPWADRHRADLQRVFMPGLAKNATPAKPLAPGEWRMATEFNLLIELDDTATIRIPIREESKNWRWRGKEPAVDQQSPTKRKQRNKTKKKNKTEVRQSRPVGWLEFKIPANSCVQYSMDMLARSTGYKNTLRIDLPNSELWSSVNHDLLWRSGPQNIVCHLSNPLGWNALRNWHFNVTSNDMKLYLLRDHIFLLIDLVNDWASGPPSDYLIFTPYNYHLHLKLCNLQAFLNTNEGNIIDSATSQDENSYLILSSPLLSAETIIPLEKYMPDKNSIAFDIRADTLGLSLQTPQWNTQSSFLRPDQLGNAEGLTVSGSYHYNATTSTANTDTLILNICGQSPQVTLHGFIIRHIMLLKDNYFGDTIHFKTVDEFKESLQAKHGDQDEARPPFKKSNDLDVILSVKVDDAQVSLPTNLYSATQFIQAELASLAVDVRFTNYYMDLELDLSPLGFSLGTGGQTDSASLSLSNTQLFIDGIRVFGHRAFGLPPSEPAYFCNWDVSVGAVRGGCSAAFISALAKGASVFAFTFDDVENALVPYSSLIFYDITFIRARVDSVSVWVHVPDAAFLLSTGIIDVKSNDWARSHYSKKARVLVPNIQVSCVDADSAAEHKSRHQHPVKTEAYLEMDLQLGSIGRKAKFAEERKQQQEMVRREDQRTDRTPFLLCDEYMDEFVAEQVDAPAHCAPPPPYPVEQDNASQQSVASIKSPSVLRKLRRQGSILSTSASSDSDPNMQGEILGLRSGQDLESSQILGNLKPLRSDGYTEMTQCTENRTYSHSAVTFSSPYFAPHFAMDGVEPDKRQLGMLDLVNSNLYDPFEDPYARLSDIDPESIPQDYAYSSTIIEIPSGITAFIKPKAIKHVTSLLEILQPTTPEDILDELQVDCVNEIFSARKQLHAAGDMSDMLVRLPAAHIRFLNSSTLESHDSSSEEEETGHYDLELSQISLVTRNISERSQGSAVKDKSRTSLQWRMNNARFSANKSSELDMTAQAAIMVEIDQVMVSLGTKDVTYLDADVGSIVGSTSSGNIEYLAALIQQTGEVASTLSRILAESSKRQENRLKLCCWHLLHVEQSANDPPFIIRPSAVLRSVEKHLRTVDSWKMAMRLRQIWAILSPQGRSQLTESCSTGTEYMPDNAAEDVVVAFQKWRSWDLENPRQALLLRRVFKNTFATPMEQQLTDDGPFLGACRLGELRFILDPGPKENRMSVTDLTSRFERKLGLSKGGQLGLDSPDELINTINIYCGQVHIDLNWELMELGQTVVKLCSNRNQPDKTPVREEANAKVTATATETKRKHQTMHVCFEIGKSWFNFECPNLDLRSVLSGFKSSTLLCKSEKGKVLNSLAMNCDAVTSRMHSHSTLFWTCQLLYPSMTASQEAFVAQLIQVTASCRGLSLGVEQDMTGLLQVADLVIRDEASQLAQLQRQIRQSNPNTDPSPTSIDSRQNGSNLSGQLSRLRIKVVLLLEGYSIELPLLQSLTYKVSGTLARAACEVNDGKELVFDFNIKDNSHDIQMNMKDKRESISFLQLPPANGRLTSRLQGLERVVEIVSSIEVVRLDASAIYSLLSALDREQMSAEMKDIQDQVGLLQRHITELLQDKDDTPTKVKTVKADKEAGADVAIVYDVHLTLAGLQALTKTRLKSKAEETFAQLLFAMDKLRLQACNRDASSGVIMKYPELTLNLQKIGFDVCRGHDGDNKRSCGNLGASFTVKAGSRQTADGKEEWIFIFMSDDAYVNLSPETVSSVIDILGHTSSRIKVLDTSRELEYLRKLRYSKPRISINDDDVAMPVVSEKEEEKEENDFLDSILASVVYQFQLRNIRASWDVAKEADHTSDDKEDLHLSISLIEFATRTNKSARLRIEDLQLQMIPPGHDHGERSPHSALLPEVTFNIAYASTPQARRLAFQAFGKSLDLRLTSAFILPAAHLVQSISLSAKNVQEASAQWTVTDVVQDDVTSKEAGDSGAVKARSTVFANKRLERLLVHVDFAGAVVHLSGSDKRHHDDSCSPRPSVGGKYGQFNVDDSGSSAVLRSPGVALKGEFRDDGETDATLYGEIKVDASENQLYPSVVPLLLDIMSNIKQVVSDENKDEQGTAALSPKQSPRRTKTSEEADKILTVDPSTVFGRLKVKLGLRICRQEFSLSCQPIARVSATTSFENFYLTFNNTTTWQDDDDHLFAISGVLGQLQASVRHVYSREATASFSMDTLTLCLMNSKHVSGVSGVSAILNISPMEVSVNARQAADFLLFREIWYPDELRHSSSAPVAKPDDVETSQVHLVQRYQEVAATTAFPWTATVSIAALHVNLDLGQSIGKSLFQIEDFWVSSKKRSDWEQNLCLGFKKIGIDSAGRLSGFITLQDFRLRTSIQWPKRQEALSETPLVQASVAFRALEIKASFDYQAFLVGHVTALEFLMYNVRRGRHGRRGDGLMAICDGDAIQLFGTTSSAAQALATYQALQRLVQEIRESFEASVKDIEKTSNRAKSKSLEVSGQGEDSGLEASSSMGRLARDEDAEEKDHDDDDDMPKSPISLDTDVVVTLKSLNLGIFPGTFSDHQVFKMEALDASANFAANMQDNGKIHSLLRMTLGQLRVGLAGVRNGEAREILSEMRVEDVVQMSTGARGGTILKVPCVEAVMETWQLPGTKNIDYKFRSTFGGKVEVGWNYSRISYIRGMLASHNKSLEQVWGRQLPMTAVKITGVPGLDEDEDGPSSSTSSPQQPQQQQGREQQQQGKITAEVKVPLSRYNYTALEEPVIETPQLRDMGEATPPLEWIGLQRDRLPNLTHQIVIVALLELAGEVEDAYSRILGSS